MAGSSFVAEMRKETRQPLQYQGLAGFYSAIFSYVFPLQIQNALNEAFHACGAVTGHLLSEVAVLVQRKGGGSVPQVGLHRLYILPSPERVHGVCMPE